MSYTVTIKRVEEVTKEEEGKYCVLRYEYLGLDEMLALPPSEHKDWKKEDNGQYSKPVYGYAPAVKKTSQVETKLFEQTVEEIDVASVIVAINGLRNVQ